MNTEQTSKNIFMFIVTIYRKCLYFQFFSRDICMVFTAEKCMFSEGDFSKISSGFLRFWKK